MLFSRIGLYLIAAFMAVVCMNLQADELLMQNDDRLTGRIIRLEGETILFQSPYAGTLRIPRAHISRIKAEEPLTVVLSNGEIIKAIELSFSEGSINIESSEKEKWILSDRSELRYINAAPWQLGEGIRFTGNVNIDIKSERGNTDKDDFEIDAEILLRRKDDRFKATGELERDKSKGSKTADNWNVFGKYDYFAGEKLYYSGNIFVEHDEFADIRFRTSIGPAIGYQFFESPDKNLAIEGGFNYVNEDFEDAPDNEYWAARWYVDFDYFLFKRFAQLFHKQQGFWNLEDSDDIDIKTETGLRFPLQAGFVATAQIDLDWDKGAPEGVEELESIYRFKLGYQW